MEQRRQTLAANKHTNALKQTENAGEVKVNLAPGDRTNPFSF